MLGVTFIWAAMLVLCALGMAEFAQHRRNLRSIGIRIHVNGTRGKSSVTRLIAAGLRQAGYITCAKTTGSLARMILPDGREIPVLRSKRPNIAEQIRVVSMARHLRAEALVVECMALKPALQWICESKLISATHGVITNVRPDHLDVMGPEPKNIAEALCGMVPTKSQMFTAETEHKNFIQYACEDRNTVLHTITPHDCAMITAQDVANFNYTEHPENIALALQVLSNLGISRKTAFAGMWQVNPDPGALTEYTLNAFGKYIKFVNGFAANDPVSTEKIWVAMCHRHAACHKHIALFNCRSDREDRSVQLGKALSNWPAPDYVVLVGTGAHSFARAAAKAGSDLSNFIYIGNKPAAEIYSVLIDLADNSTAMIMGLGNIGGEGLSLLHHFSNRCEEQFTNEAIA